MKWLLLLICFPAFAQVEHNEINQAINSIVNNALKESELLVSCEAPRSGRYQVDGVSVTSPSFTSRCRVGGIIFWEPMIVGGLPAVSYRVFYSTGTHNLVSMNTETPDIYLPIADPKAHNVTIEGYDALGNSSFTQEYEIAD